MTAGTTGTARLLGALLTAGWLAGSVTGVFAQTPERFPSPEVAGTDSTVLVPLRDDDLLVLEVRLEREGSGRGLLAYAHDGGALIPLGELASILELAIMTDAPAGRAEGWVVSEDRTFLLDVASRELVVEGEPGTLPPGSVALDGADIFVRDDLLAQWLPVDIELNFARMNLRLSPREVLPYQSRRQRQEQRALWLARHGRDELGYPLWVAPYRMWSWPMTDATLALHSTVDGTRTRFSSQSWADVGGLSANLFLTHVDAPGASRTTALLKAGRWDPDGRLLGGLGATHFEFGDLDISRVPLISGSKRGLGFTLTNRDIKRTRDFDVTEVRGEAPPGWEAELYINGTLFDFQTVGEDGRYVFAEVPLVVGENTFRTVLYGPRGEKRTVMDHANISPVMTDVGELKYTVTMLHEGSSLLAEAPVSTAGVRPWNHQVGLSYALTNESALELDLSSLSFGGDRELFTSVTSHNSLGKLHLESIGAVSTDGGRAASFGARARLAGQSLFAQTGWNDAYLAESPDGFQYVDRQTQLRAGGSLVRTARRGLTYGLASIRRDWRGSTLRQEREYQFRLSGNLGKVLLAHGLHSRRRVTGEGDDQTLLGSILSRTWIGPLSIRGDLTYELRPGRLRSASATATWYRDDDLQATLRLNHYLQESYGRDGVDLELTRLFRRFTVGANLRWYEGEGLTFGLTMGTFLARDQRSNTWVSTHRRLANRTAASVRTFVDLDNDGRYNNDDVPLAGVGFLNLSAWRGIHTNADGIALLPGVLAHRPQTIELDMATVDDPYLIPRSQGANVMGHPGSIVDVELPFAYAGEVEGLVVDAAVPELAVRHVGLELVDAAGERVSSSVTEFDGYYYLPEVLPGTYELRVIPATLNQRIYLVPEPMTLTVPGEGGFVQGPDVVLQRREPVRPTGATTAAAGAADVDLDLEGGEQAEEGADAVPAATPAESGAAVAASPSSAAPRNAAAAPHAVRPPATVSAPADTLSQKINKTLRLPRDRNCTGK